MCNHKPKETTIFHIHKSNNTYYYPFANCWSIYICCSSFPFRILDGSTQTFDFQNPTPFGAQNLCPSFIHIHIRSVLIHFIVLTCRIKFICDSLMINSGMGDRLTWLSPPYFNLDM